MILLKAAKLERSCDSARTYKVYNINLATPREDLFFISKYEGVCRVGIGNLISHLDSKKS